MEGGRGVSRDPAAVGWRRDGGMGLAMWRDGSMVTQLRLDRIALSAAAARGHTNSSLTTDSMG